MQSVQFDFCGIRYLFAVHHGRPPIIAAAAASAQVWSVQEGTLETRRDAAHAAYAAHAAHAAMQPCSHTVGE